MPEPVLGHDSRSWKMRCNLSYTEQKERQGSGRQDPVHATAVIAVMQQDNETLTWHMLQ